MQLHKIDSTLSEHQHFLAQNRKDPITGDSILDGNEVVFCASCKSVFLKDTWEYLDNKHCEQTNTLKNFPFQETINLKVKSRILFYQFLEPSIIQTYIPRKAKKYPFLTKKNKLSKYHYFLYGSIKNMFIAIIGIISLLVGLYYFFSSPLLVLGLAAFISGTCAGIIRIIRKQYTIFYGQRLKSTYKYFEKDTFYITRHSLIFCTAYGVEEYILSLKEVEKLVFYETNSSFKDSFMKIYYKNKKTTKSLKFFISNSMFRNYNSFYATLSTLSNTIFIQIESERIATVSQIQQMINQGNTNIEILNR